MNDLFTAMSWVPLTIAVLVPVAMTMDWAWRKLTGQ
jgi:hypothetical protein